MDGCPRQRVPFKGNRPSREPWYSSHHIATKGSNGTLSILELVYHTNVLWFVPEIRFTMPFKTRKRAINEVFFAFMDSRMIDDFSSIVACSDNFRQLLWKEHKLFRIHRYLYQVSVVNLCSKLVRNIIHKRKTRYLRSPIFQTKIACSLLKMT